ncbi:TIGR02996 domain-containing protein [Gemmata sp. G18]|uniref:TIGR02996 domain-containing protein n=1 Tax=Gemmata palustris TaxID=2822762 RepID=A0ABS5BR35_9BACT|nr:TIGR02996 domain-containing protein [Gemmata palustris]
MATSTETAFLHAIAANRSGATVRLTFADWLDEFGSRPGRCETAAGSVDRGIVTSRAVVV